MNQASLASWRCFFFNSPPFLHIPLPSLWPLESSQLHCSLSSVAVKISTTIQLRCCNMFWKLLLMKMIVDITLLAILAHDGWSFFTKTRKMIFIWQHGLRFFNTWLSLFKVLSIYIFYFSIAFCGLSLTSRIIKWREERKLEEQEKKSN